MILWENLGSVDTCIQKICLVPYNKHDIDINTVACTYLLPSSVEVGVRQSLIMGNLPDSLLCVGAGYR